jgi:hypothetical protein
MHRVCIKTTARRVNVRKLGQETEVSVLVEILEGNNVALSVSSCPVEEEGVGEEGAICAVIVLPADALFAGNLEDAGSVDAGHVEAVVIFAMAIRDTRDAAEAVGVCRLEIIRLVLRERPIRGTGN